MLRVLRSPIYAGLIACGDEIHAGEHAALIDRAQYERVQKRLAAHAGKPDPGRNPAYLLRGLLRCALCGGAFTPASTRHADREYRYYRCSTKDKGGRKACEARPLPAGAIEDFIVQHIRDATADGHLAADVASRIDERIQRQRKVLRTERRALVTKIAKLGAEGTSLAARLATVSRAAHRLLAGRVEEIGVALERQEARLAEVERALAALEQTEADAGWVAQALIDFDAVWDAMTVLNRGRLIRALVQRIEVDEPSGRVTATLIDLGLEPSGADAPPAEANEAATL